MMSFYLLSGRPVSCDELCALISNDDNNNNRKNNIINYKYNTIIIIIIQLNFILFFAVLFSPC